MSNAMSDAMSTDEIASLPTSSEIWDEIQSVQNHCRKRLLDGWQARRAHALLHELADYVGHEAVSGAYVRIYPDGKGSGRYSYDGTHCTIELKDGEWQINARRAGTRNRHSKDIAVVLVVPVSDADDPEVARDFRSELEAAGWNAGSGSEMRLYVGKPS
jgi:hypothetical protein